MRRSCRECGSDFDAGGDWQRYCWSCWSQRRPEREQPVRFTVKRPKDDSLTIVAAGLRRELAALDVRITRLEALVGVLMDNRKEKRHA
jgi:hypothetical protein